MKRQHKLQGYRLLGGFDVLMLKAGDMVDKGGEPPFAANANNQAVLHKADIQFQPSNGKPANVGSTGEADLGLLPFAFDAKARRAKVVI